MFLFVQISKTRCKPWIRVRPEGHVTIWSGNSSWSDFRRLPSDDEFVQSVSRREMRWTLFDIIVYSRMLIHNMDLRSPDCETACAQVEVYERDYNETLPVWPGWIYMLVNFFRHCTIYPCEKYFGVDAGLSLPTNWLKEKRLKQNRELGRLTWRQKRMVKPEKIP